MAKVERVNLYKICVNPERIAAWEGIFTFVPDADDVEAAILQEIDENDPDTECEYDDIQWLRTLLELVTYQRQELLGRVTIAGTAVGDITIQRIEAYGPQKCPPGRVLEANGMSQI